MSSFSCPHFDFASETCQRLTVACVPGRPGCVLCGKVGFIVERKERVAGAKKEQAQRPRTRKTP